MMRLGFSDSAAHGVGGHEDFSRNPPACAAVTPHQTQTHDRGQHARELRSDFVLGGAVKASHDPVDAFRCASGVHSGEYEVPRLRGRQCGSHR